MAQNPHYYAIIMAGGEGKRFWPLSTRSYPKQFLDILGNGQTLFQETYQRFQQICPEANILVVTNEDYKGLIQEQVPEISDDQILPEPVGRNTAPAVAYGAFRIQALDPDGTMVVAPSDHFILNEDLFAQRIEEGMQTAAASQSLITLGIHPTRADTGYGYIQMEDSAATESLRRVKTFTEKPNKELAEYFLNSGEFLWNAGIFIWHTQTVLDSFQQYMPELYESLKEGRTYFNTAQEPDFIREVYPTLPMTSVDYGIMEKAEQVYVLPANFQWSDIGTWNSVFELLGKDEKNNALQGKQIFTRNAKDSLVQITPDKLVALNNVDNLIVVDTGDCLLIADRNEEQEIRQVVNEIKARYGERYT
jgi:mannose-1-phosphate guanylyltransferase